MTMQETKYKLYNAFFIEIMYLCKSLYYFACLYSQVILLSKSPSLRE